MLINAYINININSLRQKFSVIISSKVTLNSDLFVEFEIESHLVSSHITVLFNVTLIYFTVKKIFLYLSRIQYI